MRLVLALLVLSGVAAAQQTVPAPPPPPEDPCEQPGAESDPRCREQPPPGPAVGPGVVVDVPIGVPHVEPRAGAPGGAAKVGAPSGKGGGSGGCGNMDGRALLLVAVIAAVALPAVVYAVDDDAEEADLERYDTFHTAVDVWAGAVSTDHSNPFGLTGLRARVTQGRFGVEASFEGTPFASDWRSGNVSLLVRMVPKKHVEIGFAIGGRWSALNGEQHLDAELAVPHKYVFFHSGDQTGGLEVRPAVLVGTHGGDVRLDVGLVVPIDRFALNVGVRAFSYDFQTVNLAAVGGVSARF